MQNVSRLPPSSPSSPLAAAVLNKVQLRIVVPLVLLFVCQLLLLIRLIPETLHRDQWRMEQVYGSYENQLFAVSLSNAALQFVCLIVVLIWMCHGATQCRDACCCTLTTPVLGFVTERPPWIVDIIQAVSIVLDLVSLAHVQLFVLVVVGMGLFLSLTIVGWRLWPVFNQSLIGEGGNEAAISAPGPAQTWDRATALGKSRTIAFVALAVVVVFCLLLFAQSSETFSTGYPFFTSDDLVRMNDDRQRHNRDLAFHAMSERAADRLAHGTLPMHRVLLIVVDGLRDDFVERNAEMRRVFRERAARTWRGHARAALPTMSAPNWLALLTGAPPKITGLHGNILPGETQFDTIISRQSRIDGLKNEFLRGIVGCAWWSTMVQSRFPRYKGDGTVNAQSMYRAARKVLPPFKIELPSVEQMVPLEYPVMMDQSMYSETWDAATDDATDAYRTRIAKEMIEEDDFRFLLVHFANPDTQAHYSGVRDAYDEAVSRTAGYIDDLLTAVDRDEYAAHTTVIITADHGEVDAGGHGGPEDVLQRIPLLIYRSSNDTGWLGPMMQLAATQTWKIEDVAPTVSALLSLPVPRQATGDIIWPALLNVSEELNNEAYMTALDAYEARREWLDLFFLESRFTTRQRSAVLDDVPELGEQWKVNRSAAELRQATEALGAAYDAWTDTLAAHVTARNMILCSIFSVFAVAGMCALLDRGSFVWHGLRFWECGSCCVAHGAGRTIRWTDGEAADNLIQINGFAFATAFVVVALYLVVQFAVVIGWYSALGYRHWDSTMVHTPAAVRVFVLTSLVTGTLLMFLLVRLYHSPCLEWEQRPLPKPWRKQPCCQCARGCLLLFANCGRLFLVERTTADGHVKSGTPLHTTQHMVWLLLVRWHVWFLAFFTMMVLLVMQGLYAFWLPLYNNWTLSEFTWGFRFRIFSSQIMIVPLLCGAVASLFAFSATNVEQNVDWGRLERAQSVSVVRTLPSSQPSRVATHDRPRQTPPPTTRSLPISSSAFELSSGLLGRNPLTSMVPNEQLASGMTWAV